MVGAAQRFVSFEDYLAFDDGSDRLCELFNGELIPVPPESGRNVQIANRLFFQFALLVGTDRVRGQGLELEVRGEPRNRFPDLTVILPEHIEQLQQRNTLRLQMAPPALVVEVVSPGELQRSRDYIAKRQQYEDRGVPEYWILDPEEGCLTLCVLADGRYGDRQLRAGRLESPSFPAFNLTIAQILVA